MPNTKLKESLIKAISEYTPKDNVKLSKKDILRVISREKTRVEKNKTSLSKSSRVWLLENYYMIERAMEGVSLKEKSTMSKLCYITNVFVKNAEGITNESVSNLFETVCQNSFTRDLGLELMHNALIYSAVSEIAERCERGEELGEKIELLRKLLSFDMSNFVVGFSEAERYLRCDPAGVWQKMGKESRNLYKKKIYEMAKRTKSDYYTVCRSICTKAMESSSHIGNYIDFKSYAAPIYYLLQGILFVLFSVLSGVLLFGFGINFMSVLLFLVLISVIYETSMRLAAFLVSLFAKSEILPRLEIDTLDAKTATLVTIPVLISKKEELVPLINRLEEIYIKSRSRKGEDSALFLSILADFPDSDESEEIAYKDIISYADTLVGKLNAQYGEHFVFFTRAMVWDKEKGKYSAHERKRGALLELTKFALKKKSSISFKGASIPLIKYILTLDSDTDIGIGDLYKMVGTMEHPLNRPETVEKNGVCFVEKGYGILQPVISTSLKSAFATPFSLITSGVGGFDIYSGPLFDLYHALFRRSMFCGKGIFDAECYLRVLENAFPDGIVLSHDMLEGSRLRAGLLCDVVASDTTPKNIISYYKRAHRWTRGDIQSLVFITRRVMTRKHTRVKNPQPISDRLVFLSNFIFLLSPIFSCLSLILALSLDSSLAGRVFVIATSPLWLYSVIQFLNSLWHLSFYRLFRLFFTRAITGFCREILHLFFSLSALFFRAWQNFHALCTCFVRLFYTNENLLEWNTFAEVEKQGVKKGGIGEYFIFTLPSFIAGVFFLLFSINGYTRLFGILWTLFFIIGYFSSKSRATSYKISKKEKKTIIEYAKSTWNFFDKVVSDEDNFLPCDNFSLSPKKALAHRTSPTNIGLYLISLVSALDFGFIDKQELLSRLEKTLITLEKLPKYKGHLYNWYNTKELSVLGNAYISSVDSGNFAVCLVTLVCSLRELGSEFYELADRFETLEKDMDFRFLYDKSRRLFSIGYDVSNNTRDSGYYDLYMSEMRTTDYYAVSRGIVEKEHWSALSRALVSRYSRIGSASWSGTAFEFFMPQLFLPVFENSFSDEVLSFAFLEQMSFCAHSAAGSVWGISESGYYAFDRDMNYQYRAFGVPRLSLARHNANDIVISPYSSFLMLPQNPTLCLENLKRQKELGAYSDWGFFEAIDFSPERAGGGFEIVKSYMAHHVGMSLVAMANAVFDNIFVKRFMADREMASGVELLLEKVPVDAVITPNKKREEQIVKGSLPSADSDVFSSRDFERQSIWSLFGRELSLVACESGVLELSHENQSFIKPSFLSQGLSFLPYISTESFFSPKTCQTKFTYGRGFIRYSNSKSRIKINLSDEGPALRIGFKAKEPFCKCGFYFLPSFVPNNAYISHPSYTELFFEGDFDREQRVLWLDYHGKNPFYMCVVSDSEFDFELFREKLFVGKDESVYNLEKAIKGELSNKTGTLISPCVLVRSRKNAVFVMGFGKTRAEALRVASAELSKSSQKSASSSEEYERRLMRASGIREYDRVLFERLLASFYPAKEFNFISKLPNVQGRSALWKYGVSGDLPICLVSAGLERRTLEKIMRAHKFHYIGGLRYDVVIYCQDDGYNQKERNTVYELLEKTQSKFTENISGGIFVVGKEAYELFSLSASVILSSENDIRDRESSFEYDVCPKECMPRRTQGRAGFLGNSYMIDKGEYNPQILWHHILSSGSFGTVVSTRSLGHTWVYNAGLSRITLWQNDKVSSSLSEKLYCEKDGVWYDLCDMSAFIEFTPGMARYVSEMFEITVSINPKFLYKEVRVKSLFEGDIKLYYRLFATMGDGASRVGRIYAEKISNGVRFLNPLSDGITKGFSFLVCPFDKVEGYERGVIMQKKCIVGEESVFCLGFAGGDKHFERSLAEMKTPSLEKSIEYARSFLTFDKKIWKNKKYEHMYNTWLMYQCTASRILGRTGPYQSGGAFGARDQTQDMLFLIKTHPDIVKSHLFRVASHQFVEGDVLHWWHGFRGTRTKCSDDYLWFVLLLCEYYKHTKDEAVFKTEVGFVESQPLSENERERYEIPTRSTQKESLAGHAVRALNLFVERGVGKNGLALMGSGDWNDGMDMVGQGGGESVWLSFAALIVFHLAKELLSQRGMFLPEWDEFCQKLYESIEKNAFFKDRYARAFLSDGSVMGCESFEGGCKIDGIAEGFASICHHITGKGNVAHICAGLDSAWRELYDEKNKLFRLFSPAFSQFDSRVGYVTTYPEGVRENGGQYTHGAVFSALGFLWAPAEKKKNLERAKKILSAILTCDKDPDILKTEPYVLSADVYDNPTHQGRGGWSFYTGSAGWCHFLMEEIHKEENKE